MSAPGLDELPPPPAGREGWPWTETPPMTSPGTGAAGGDDSAWPLISIVTPSMNQGAFLEATIRSVLLQGYPRLEYVVMDGGSTDGSREIIERYAQWIDHWQSEPDGGQYDAICRGLSRCRGEVMAWINSDDLYLPGALRIVAGVLSTIPSVEWLTTLRPFWIDHDGPCRPARRLPGFARECFWRGEYVIGIRPVWSGWIPQEATFWRRSLWQRCGGGPRADLDMAGDFELWARLAREAGLFGVDAPLAAFRRQADQKTAVARQRYEAEAREVLEGSGGRPNSLPRALLRLVVSRSPLAIRVAAGRLGAGARAEIIVPEPGSAGSGWRLVETWV